MILTIIVFLLIIGVLVVVHEFGHFIVAKKVGVKVEEFAVGFPPRLLSIKKGETSYSINAIPLGGYVKMLGELEHSTDKRAFENQKPVKRFWISIAGVIMNLILAWFLLTIGFAVGMSPIVSNPDSIPGKTLSSEIIIADVTKDSAAEKAGLQSEDILISGTINNSATTFSSPADVTAYTKSHQGETVSLVYKRDGDTFSHDAVLSKGDSPLGIAMVYKAIVKVAWYRAPYVALHETYEVVKLTFEFLGSFFAKLFTSGKVAEGVEGPVAIYVYTGLAVKAGFMVILQFVALLSINLALLNILPFPALDGGRLVFIVLERFFGKKVVKENVENIIHTVGFVVLILLMIVITYKDVIKLFNK